MQNANVNNPNTDPTVSPGYRASYEPPKKKHSGAVWALGALVIVVIAIFASTARNPVPPPNDTGTPANTVAPASVPDPASTVPSSVPTTPAPAAPVP